MLSAPRTMFPRALQAGVLLQRQLSACAQGSQRPWLKAPFPVLGGRGVLRALLRNGGTALTLPGLSSAQRLLPAARREVQDGTTGLQLTNGLVWPETAASASCCPGLLLHSTQTLRHHPLLPAGMDINLFERSC